MKRKIVLVTLAVMLLVSPTIARAETKTLQEVIDSTTIETITAPVVKLIDVSIRTLLKVIALPFWVCEQISDKY